MEEGTEGGVLLPQDVLDVIGSYMWAPRLEAAFAAGATGVCNTRLIVGSEFWTPTQWMRTCEGVVMAVQCASEAERVKVMRGVVEVKVKLSSQRATTLAPEARLVLSAVCGFWSQMSCLLAEPDVARHFSSPSEEESGAVLYLLFRALLASGRAEDLLRRLQEVQAGVEWDAVRGRAGWTVLHAAAACDEAPAVRWLSLRVPLEARTEREETALHVAARQGSYSAVVELLRHRASLAARDAFGATPFSLAAEGGHVEVGAALLAAGASPAVFLHDLSTPLHVAAQNGHADFLRLVLCGARHVNLLARTGANLSALDLAARHGHALCLRILLDSGAYSAADLHAARFHAEARGHAACAALIGAARAIESPVPE
jgi:Ankyrin repeats (3 copies)/Ankyrin repeats (many copies)